MCTYERPHLANVSRQRRKIAQLILEDVDEDVVHPPFPNLTTTASDAAPSLEHVLAREVNTVVPVPSRAAVSARSQRIKHAASGLFTHRQVVPSSCGQSGNTLYGPPLEPVDVVGTSRMLK